MLVLRSTDGNYYHIEFIRKPVLDQEWQQHCNGFKKYCWVTTHSFYSIDSIWNEYLRNIIDQRFPKAKYHYTNFGNVEITFTNKADEAAFILLADSEIEVNDC